MRYTASAGDAGLFIFKRNVKYVCNFTCCISLVYFEEKTSQFCIAALVEFLDMVVQLDVFVGGFGQPSSYTTCDLAVDVSDSFQIW